MARRSSSRSPSTAITNSLSAQSIQPKLSRRERWLGTPDREAAIPRHTPEGMEALQMLLRQGTQGLQNPLAGFGPIKDDILRTYREELLPTIAQRFASMGSHGGALNSSGYEGEKNLLAERLSQQLAAQEASYGLQNRQGLLDMIQLGLTPQYDYRTLPGQQGNLDKFLFPAAAGAANFLNFIPGVGPLAAGAAKAGIGTARNALASRRGERTLPYNMQNFGPDIVNQDTINNLQGWLQDRRARAKTAQPFHYTPLSARPSLRGY